MSLPPSETTFGKPPAGFVPQHAEPLSRLEFGDFFTQLVHKFVARGSEVELAFSVEQIKSGDKLVLKVSRDGMGVIHEDGMGKPVFFDVFLDERNVGVSLALWHVDADELQLRIFVTNGRNLIHDGVACVA